MVMVRISRFSSWIMVMVSSISWAFSIQNLPFRPAEPGPLDLIIYILCMALKISSWTAWMVRPIFSPSAVS